MKAPSILASFAALLASGGLIAQEAPAPSFGERVEVEVVNVDVIASDAQGKPVTDLTAGDFELLVDGKRVPIEYFAAARGPAPRPASSPQVPPASAPDASAATAPLEATVGDKAFLLIYVDLSALELRATTVLVEQLRRFVSPRLDGQTEVTLAAFTDSLSILCSKATTAGEVEAAMARLENLRGRGNIVSVARNSVEMDIRRAGNAPSGPQRANFLITEALQIETELRTLAEQEFDRQTRSVAALRNWVDALAGIVGRKSVVLATKGVASNPTEYLLELYNQKRGLLGASRSQLSFVSEGIALMADFQRMLNAAQNARVAFYTISPGPSASAQGSAEFGGMGGEFPKAMPRDQALVEAASSVVQLAAATGGRNLVLDTRLADQLAVVLADESAAYSLGFTTGQAAGDATHKIEVRTARPGVKLRHREAYRRRTFADRVEEALTAAATLETVNNSLGISLDLGPAGAPAKGTTGALVPMLVRIPLRGLALAPQPKDFAGRISVRVAIKAAGKRLILGQTDPLSVLVPESAQGRIASDFWSYRAQLRLSPGTNQIAVVVVDDVSGAFATATAAVQVPKQ